MLANKNLKEYVTFFIEDLMTISKHYQIMTSIVIYLTVKRAVKFLPKRLLSVFIL